MYLAKEVMGCDQDSSTAILFSEPAIGQRAANEDGCRAIVKVSS
jgi:hypothetical protein